MSYDIETRKTPVKFRLCNYGIELERIRYGELNAYGKITNPETPLDDCGSPDEIFLITKEISHPDLIGYYLAITVTDMDEHGCIETDDDARYVIEIVAVSPRSCSVGTLESACEALKNDKDMEIDVDGPWMAYDLVHYGKCAHCWQACGDDLEELMQEAKSRIGKIESLIGFYLDQRQNAMGDSGWSWIKDDVTPKKRKKRQ